MARYSLLALSALIALCAPVYARDPLPPPPPLNPPLVEQPVSPYPMSYSEELAQRLGISKGHMDVFTVGPERDDTFVPSLKGGVDKSGVGLKLQWQMGK